MNIETKKRLDHLREALKETSVKDVSFSQESLLEIKDSVDLMNLLIHAILTDLKRESL